MGTNNLSILRVGLTGKNVTAGMAFLLPANVKRNQSDFTGDGIKSNMNTLVAWTVEISPQTDGDLTVHIDDGTFIRDSVICSCTAGKMAVVEFFADAAWPITFSYSVNTTLDIFCVSEHGGLY